MVRRGIVPLRPVAVSARRESSTEELSDDTLVARIGQKEGSAEEALFLRHVDYIWALSFRLVGNRGDADDIVQETFLDALAHLRELRAPESVRSWIAGIAVHKAHRLFRRRRLLTMFLLHRAPIEGALEACVRTGPFQETHVELGLVDDALRGVSEWERAAWVLRFVEGYSLEEVAALCGCSLATAKRRIRKAQASVRRFLDIEGVDADD